MPKTKESLKKQLDEMKLITCRGPGMSEACKYSGPVETFLPNYSGYHNACRCPNCGSTRNNYNRLHSELVTLQCREAEQKLKLSRQFKDVKNDSTKDDTPV